MQASSAARARAVDQDLPAGRDSKRGSFEGLIAEIEETTPTGRRPTISSAAYEAGVLVRGMRQKAGLSQRTLADRIGVSQSRVSEIEAGIGAQGPTWLVMDRIADACGQQLIAMPLEANA